MLRLVISRLILAAIPFLIYFAWRRWLISRGREAAPPPWGWMVAAACVLVGVSILIKVAVTPSNVGRQYVPAETRQDGSVKPGRYE